MMRGMVPRQQWFEIARTARRAGVAATLGMALLAALALPADARGGHGMDRDFAGHGPHGTEVAGGRRHGNDSYMKAASEERDKLLTTKLKSICRGC
jgi:hypothetical protein